MIISMVYLVGMNVQFVIMAAVNHAKKIGCFQEFQFWHSNWQWDHKSGCIRQRKDNIYQLYIHFQGRNWCTNLNYYKLYCMCLLYSHRKALLYDNLEFTTSFCSLQPRYVQVVEQLVLATVHFIVTFEVCYRPFCLNM